MAWFIFFHQKILLYLCKFISPNRISQTDWIYTSLSRGQHFIFGSSDSYIWLTHWHWEQIDHNLKSSKSINLALTNKSFFSSKAQDPRTQLWPVVAPKIRISARKSIFSYGNLFFRTATWVAQVVTQILRPTDLVYDFSFPSYARFREGTRSMPQKVFPHPTVRAPSASNSPSALSARTLWAG